MSVPYLQLLSSLPRGHQLLCDSIHRCFMAINAHIDQEAMFTVSLHSLQQDALVEPCTFQLSSLSYIVQVISTNGQRELGGDQD